MKERIIQIIPAPETMTWLDSGDTLHRVACLALVDCSNAAGETWQEVRAMSTINSGPIEEVYPVFMAEV